jgi:broad specificity phosphatase PhoE
MINNYGVAQCASLCMSFARMDKVTHILSSPLQRSIMTASHAFRPITDRGVKVLLVPGLREVNGSFRCNQGSPIKFLAWQQAEIRKVPINFSLVKAQKGWELIDYTPILETHAFDTIEMIYNMAKEFIKKGELNAEGNVELLVVGHAGMLGALIGYDGKFSPFLPLTRPFP